jgi:hypothetical protein
MRLMLTFAALAALLAAHPSRAQSLKAGEVFSTIAVQPLAEPNPVLGADGRVHLAYELLVVNPSNLFVTLDRVEAVDGEGRSLAALDGDRLAAMTKLYAGAGRTLPPGGSAIVFMDVSLGKDAPPPAQVAARITATRQIAGPDGKPAPVPADLPFPASFTLTGAPARIGAPAVVISPPLKGRGWIAVNGCCDSITSHRGAVMAVNGRLRVPERFAIDWMQLDASDQVFKGDRSKLASYPFYGDPILAVADGVVVNLYDGAGEQIPGAPAKGINAENVGGNMVVVDIGGGAYAFYAHMQRGSLRVKLGDRVKTGQTIGLLGDTGNSDAPHLHFHVMDGPSPLNANGLPFVFTHFASRGVLAPGSLDAIMEGGTAKLDPRLGGPHRDELPLNDEVVDFDQ